MGIFDISCQTPIGSQHRIVAAEQRSAHAAVMSSIFGIVPA